MIIIPACKPGFYSIDDKFYHAGIIFYRPKPAFHEFFLKMFSSARLAGFSLFTAIPAGKLIRGYTHMVCHNDKLVHQPCF
jgi:hypothetical protein